MNWFVLGGLVAGVVAFGRPRRLHRPVIGSSRGGDGPDGARSDGPAVVVIVPARDEAERIGGLLDGVVGAGRGRPHRTIVVDDHSSDDTYRCAVDAGAEVVRAPDLPAGWAGKPWACHHAITRLHDEPDETVVVFLDADVRVDPGAVDALVAAQATRGGVVSVAPYHEVPTVAEQANAVFNVVQVMGIGAGTRRPRGLFGPVVCTTLGELRRIGDHASVHDRVVEDLALARRFRDAGTSVHTFVGAPFRIRMYQDGLAALWRGWSKNIAMGARHTPPLRVLSVSWWIAAMIVATSDLWAAVTDPSARATAVVAYAAAVVVFARLTRRVGSFHAATSILFPVPLGVFLAVFTTSVWSTHVRRSITWRGRSIAVPTGSATGPIVRDDRDG